MTRFPQAGIGRPLALRGATGQTGQTGASGAGAVYTSVDSLHANPRGVTDWGPILNTQIALGPNQRLVFGPFAYPFSTSINAQGTVSICFEGASGFMWPGDSWAASHDAARLIWKGSGATGAILYGGSNGFTIRDMGVYYDNTGGSFTGRLLDPVTGNPTARAHFVRAELGSLGGSLTTAAVIVSLDNVITSTVEKCSVFGAAWAVKGRDTTYSNANQIKDNTFQNCTSAFIGNPWNDWTISGNTFEVGSTPAVLADDFGSDTAPQFSFHDNGIWDVTVTTPLINIGVHNICDASFENNRIFAQQGPVFLFTGGRSVSIVDNHIECTVDSAIIDLGDTGAGAVAKQTVHIDRNHWNNASASDGVLHRGGHGTSSLYVGSNGESAHTKGLRSLPGYERLAFPVGYTAPTVVAQTALGTGGSAAITGTDLAGYVSLSAGTGPSAGVLAKVTFGTTMLSSPATPQSRAIVQLFPLYVAGAVDAGFFQDIGLVDGTGFWIASKNAPAGNIYVGYRVVMM